MQIHFVDGTSTVRDWLSSVRPVSFGDYPRWFDVTTISIRRWHSYIGLFIAPSVLFFSLTGAVQLFSLHESHGKYRPPPILEKLSAVHKDQVFALGDHHGPAEDAAPDGGKPPGDRLAPAGAEDPEAKFEPSTFMLKVSGWRIS
jgi:hypothetical protein